MTKVAAHLALVVGLPGLLALGCGSRSKDVPDDGHAEIHIGSTESGAGALEAEIGSTDIEVFESAQIGDLTLWSAGDPGLETIESDEPDEGLYALDDEVAVSLELTALDAGARFKFGDVTLDQPGDSATLGSTPFHAHGEWQVVLPQGVDNGEYELSFKLTTTAPGYAESEPTTVKLTPTAGSDHDDGDHDE